MPGKDENKSSSEKLWEADKLQRKARVEAFTKIALNKKAPRVISIEASFGEGKTTFSNLWMDYLAQSDAPAIYFDAWATDGSGDPLLAFMAALVRACPKAIKEDDTKFAQFGKSLVKIAGAGVRVGGRALLREGIDDLTDFIADGIGGEAKDFLERIDGDLDSAMTKAAAAEIADHLHRHELRASELKKRLDYVRAALTGSADGRIIVIIDELDRCRPDYAISLLEAIKHLFDHPGFVFALMLSPDRLESTAASMFGPIDRGEPYTAKFVDLRLRLGRGDLAGLVKFLSENLPEYQPWNAHRNYAPAGVAAKVTKFALRNDVSARQIIRAFKQLETIAFLFPDAPLDAGLLVSLALSRNAVLRDSSAEDQTQELLRLQSLILRSESNSGTAANLTNDSVNCQAFDSRSRLSPMTGTAVRDERKPFHHETEVEIRRRGRGSARQRAGLLSSTGAYKDQAARESRHARVSARARGGES